MSQDKIEGKCEVCGKRPVAMIDKKDRRTCGLCNWGCKKVLGEPDGYLF